MNGSKRSATSAPAVQTGTERGNRDAWELLIDQQLTVRMNECAVADTRPADRPSAWAARVRCYCDVTHQLDSWL